MKKIKTSINANDFQKVNEKNYGKSLTVPDQTMSIRTILDRHSRGLPISGVKVPIFNGEDDDLPDFRTLDLAERQELAHLYQNELKDIKTRQYTKIDKNDENQDNVRVNAVESNSGEPKADL